MKNLLGVTALAWLAAAPAWAGYQKGSQTLSFSLGPSSVSDELQVNNGDDKLKDCGGAGGFQYLYFVRRGPTLGIGPDILWSDLTEKDDPSNLVSGAKSKAALRTAVYQVVGKLAYPDGHWRPYVLGGLGAARSSLQAEVDKDGDVRPTFDSIKVGFAATWGAGLEWFPGEHFFLGLEFRQVLLTRSLHEPTDYGRALNVASVREPASLSTGMLRLGWKWGAR